VEQCASRRGGGGGLANRHKAESGGSSGRARRGVVRQRWRARHVRWAPGVNCRGGGQNFAGLRAVGKEGEQSG
jgi:hypothetical protein